MNKHIPMPLQACTNFGVKSVINQGPVRITLISKILKNISSDEKRTKAF
jgi:hypothetical protein